MFNFEWYFGKPEWCVILSGERGVVVSQTWANCVEKREIVDLSFRFLILPLCDILESQNGVLFVVEREKWGQTSLSKLASWPSEISVWLYSLSGSEILEVQFDCREFWLAANSGRSLSRRGRRVRFCARGMESCSWQRSTAWSAAHPALCLFVVLVISVCVFVVERHEWLFSDYFGYI